MTSGYIRYESSKELRTIIEQLMKDFGYAKLNLFMMELFKGKTFEVKLEKSKLSHSQSVDIKPNAYQLNDMHKLLMSKISEGQKNRQNTLSVSDYRDTQKLIADMHLDRSEVVETKDIKNLKHTSSGEIGLTPLSPQFADCYLKILKENLYLFDREIALPKITLLNDEDHYLIELKDRIDSLPEFSKEKKTNKEKGIKQTQIRTDDIEYAEQCFDNFKESLDSDGESLNKTNQKIVEVMMNTVNELDNIQENRKAVAYAIAQIQDSMNDVYKGKRNNKNNVKYILHLLQNIKIQFHTIEEPNAKIIEQVKQNLAILNKHIADYNYEIYKNNLVGKEQLKHIIKVMNVLRIIAIKNHNLINSFIG